RLTPAGVPFSNSSQLKSSSGFTFFVNSDIFMPPFSGGRGLNRRLSDHLLIVNNPGSQRLFRLPSPLLGHKAAAKVMIFLFTVYGLQFTDDYFYGLLTKVRVPIRNPHFLVLFFFLYNFRLQSNHL
ncbi:MAG: hypothetical protein K6E15_09780, partial [Prevotella sp.]|nr:hypothetical protein [Prevotella sp.]